MLVFAWILWSIEVIYLFCRIILFIGAFFAYCSNGFTYVRMSLIRLLLNISVFVFLNILIFGGYL